MENPGSTYDLHVVAFFFISYVLIVGVVLLNVVVIIFFLLCTPEELFLRVVSFIESSPYFRPCFFNILFL